jgi:methionine sulfoxide reductase heme-binding subunit
MSARTDVFRRDVREPAPVREPSREVDPPRKLARGSSRVVTSDVTPDLPRRESPRELTHRLGRREPTLLAVALLAAYLGQALMHLDVAWLAAWQRDETYKLATGGALLAFLAMQWLFARRSREVHLWLGALAPLVLYAHATRFAYGYLAWLVAVYLGVGAVGLLHRPIITRRARRLYIAWFIAHLALSVLLLVLAAYHVVIAIAYE